MHFHLPERTDPPERSIPVAEGCFPLRRPPVRAGEGSAAGGAACGDRLDRPGDSPGASEGEDPARRRGERGSPPLGRAHARPDRHGGGHLFPRCAGTLSVKGKTVEFNLPPQYGGRRISLPIYKWKTIKTAEAQDRRPVVIMELCIGSRRVRTHVNLNDRANVKYPLLIGRNTLTHDFVVECGTSYCTQPSCPEVKSK